MIEEIREKIRWVRAPDFLAVLALFFLSLFFFYDLLEKRFLLIERDLGPYFIPPRFFWVESIKHGSFPLWNPYQFSGQPFFANPQHALLYPLNGLFFLLPFDVALNGIIILHFFLGGLFTYLLLRDFKINVTGSLISGLTFMLSGYLLSVHSLLTIFLSSVWTPLIIMFFRRTILRPGLKNEAFTAIFITISFLGGGLEIVYGNFLVLLIMVIFSPFPYVHVLGQKCSYLDCHSGLDPESSISKLDSRRSLPRNSIRGVNDSKGTEFVGDKPRRYKLFSSIPTSRFLCSVPIYWGRIRSLLIVSILFLFLSAIQLFPFIELFHHSIRGNGISYQEATTWSFAPKDVLLFFLPDAYGYWLDMKKYWAVQCWFKTLYTGGLPFILSLIFFLMPHRRTLCSEEKDRTEVHRNNKMLFLILMILSIFLSLGAYNPLYPFVFKYIPFFNGIRYPAKFLYIFILLLSVTAGMGFQRLFDLSKEGGGKRIKNLLTTLSLISGLLLLFLALGHRSIEQYLKLREIDFPQFNYLSANLFHAKRFFFYLALFFLLLRTGYEKKWKGWTKILLILFLITDLFGNMGYYWKEKTSDYFEKTKILKTISSDKGSFRVFSTAKTISQDATILIGDPSFLNTLKEKHYPSMNLLYQLHDLWGADVIRVKRTDDLYRVFVSTPSILATQLIDLYGVKYITSVTLLEKNHKFELIYANLEGLQGKREDLLKENTIKLYENHSPLPRAWLLKDFKVMGLQKMLWMMLQKEFRPGQEVFLEEEPKWTNSPSPSFNPPIPPFVKGGEGGISKGGLTGLEKPFSGTQNKGGHRGPPLQRTNDVGGPLGGLHQKVQILTESNNRLDLQADAEENSLLVLSDTYYPGWKAFVDGKKTKIYRADYTFRAISVSAGTHRVEFVYDPLSFKLGALFTMLGVIGCVGVTMFRGKPNNTHQKFPLAPLQ